MNFICLWSLHFIYTGLVKNMLKLFYCVGYKCTDATDMKNISILCI